jgi:hypothetical protein
VKGERREGFFFKVFCWKGIHGENLLLSLFPRSLIFPLLGVSSPFSTLIIIIILNYTVKV